METGSRFLLAAAYAAISFIWGSTYLAIKVGLGSFDPLFFVGFRYILAALLLVPVMLIFRERFSGAPARWAPALAIGVMFIAISNGLVFWGETRLDSGYVALLITASPVWTAALTPLLPGEPRLGGRGWFGIALGALGTVVLLAPWRTAGFEMVGALAIELSVVVWAIAALWVRRVGDRYQPVPFTIAQMVAGAVPLLALSGARGTALVAPLTWQASVSLAYLVVFGSCVAFLAYFYLLRHWSATKVSSVAYLNPIVALLLGALVLGEPVTALMVVGTAVVLAGVALVLRDRREAAADELGG